MVVEVGYVIFVEKMLQGLSVSFVGKFVVCVVVKSKNFDVLRVVLESDLDLVDFRDEDGRILFVFVVFIGYDIGVEYMLIRFGGFIQIVYIKSEDGFFFIYLVCVVSCKICIVVFKVILKYYLDIIEMFNLKG